MRALARHLQAVRDRSSDSPPRLDLPTVTRARSWTFRCKPLMSNARILAQLEKFARDINAETVSLKQRVPGSSPSAPTKRKSLQRSYNEQRPHSALGYLTPAAYAANLTATCDRLRNPRTAPPIARRSTRA